MINEIDRPLSAHFPPTSSIEVGGEFSHVFDRIKTCLGVTKDTELATALGLKQGSISTAKAQKHVPPGWITKISSEKGISSDWLLYGTGPMKRGEGQVGAGGVVVAGGAPFYTDTDADMPALRMVPKRKARLCAGTGSLTTDETVTGYYAFRHEFLARKGNPAKMALVEVYGDSMSPEICDGDTVLVDESQREILAGRIYAVGMGEEVVIKEVYKKPGKLLLISKNPAYGIEEIDLAEVDGLVRIVGRVLWWCREAR